MFYQCPVCGYKRLPEPPRNFSICASCGTEFGYDDASHGVLREKWIAAGAAWFSTATRPPANWNPWWQLQVAGFEFDESTRIQSGENMTLTPDVAKLRISLREMLEAGYTDSRLRRPCHIGTHPASNNAYCETHLCLSGIYENMCAVGRGYKLLQGLED